MGNDFEVMCVGYGSTAGNVIDRPAPNPVFHDPLGRPLRLTDWPDSGGYPTAYRGGSVTLRSPRNTPLAWTDGLVAQTRWGNPPGHVPGVRFATREPAADACTFYGSDGCCWNAEW